MNDFIKILRNHKLRPTQQRVSLGKLLFGKGNRHVTAEILKHESDDENLKVSQATVYNVLNDFYNAGLVSRKEAYVNWDPVEKTVLANEQVINGKGWRSDAVVERKKLSQWFFNISKFSNELLD